MDQNQTTDNKLEQAIDDIINAEPVFSDPVAAPSSIPEGDTGKMAAPIGPFPDSKVEMVEPAPEPIAPLQSMNNIPELNIPMPEPTLPTPVAPPMPEFQPEPAPTIEKPEVDTAPLPNSTAEIKKAALRDLIPILDKVNMDTTDKFNIYKDIFNDLKDYTVLDPAYRTAREIPDETKRAEALLYLIESIDRM